MAKKFRFELEQILELRQFETRAAEAELGKAVTEENRIQELLNDLARKHAKTVKAADGQTDIHLLYSTNQYLILLQKKQEEYLRELTQAHMVTEEKRAAFAAALQKSDALEELKKQSRADWKKANIESENQENDEISNSKYSPNGSA